MNTVPNQTALIVGVGDGLSASLARKLSASGTAVALASRNPSRITGLAKETGAITFACDAAQPESVAQLFADVVSSVGTPDIVVYNPSARVHGPIAGLDPAEVGRALAVTAFGGFLVGQQAARCMLPRRAGTILFTGASASTKGYPLSAPFAMGKFALRGLAQSMARELAPQDIHVAHIVIDGGIRSPGRVESADAPDSMLDPDAIAEAYLTLINQPRTAWTHELELRPWTERF